MINPSTAGVSTSWHHDRGCRVYERRPMSQVTSVCVRRERRRMRRKRRKKVENRSEKAKENDVNDMMKMMETRR